MNSDSITGSSMFISLKLSSLRTISIITFLITANISAGLLAQNSDAKLKKGLDNTTIKRLQGSYSKYKFDEIGFPSIKKHIQTNIKADKNLTAGSAIRTQLRPGTILLFRTNDKRYGKLQIISYGQRNFKARWVTYDHDGNVFSKGDDLIAKGTFHYDLDYGKSEKYSESKSEFWWTKHNPRVGYIKPENGALIGIY